MGLAARLDMRAGYDWTVSPSPFRAAEQLSVFALSFTDGTGSGQANFVYKNDFSILTTATLSIDLKGGGGETDVRNVLMAATAVKAVLLKITTPGAGTSIRFGPQNVANAAQLWFQAATANFYDVVEDTLVKMDRVDGWALDATHKVVSLHNPGASTVAGTLWIFGTK